MMARLCDYTPSSNRFVNSRTQSRTSVSEKSCYDSLDRKYINYAKDLSGQKKIALWKLKNFLKSFLEISDSHDDLVELFGEGNIFTRGEIKATTNQGHDFINYFHTGVFSGLGVIDEYKRDDGERAPASIPVGDDI